MILLIGAIVCIGNIVYLMLVMVNFNPMSVFLVILLVVGILLWFVGILSEDYSDVK